jgi:Leucine-rich repeat (LRR) protein
MTTKTIQDYLAKQQVLDEQTIVTEDTDYVDFDTMDKEALQTVIDWAKVCNISEYTVPYNIRELANAESLNIHSYTQALPEAIGSLTQLKILSLMNTESLPNGVEDSLPDSIGNLINLETLSLDYQDYVFNFEVLKQLKSLKFLTINFYDAHRLPDMLEDLRCDISLRLCNEQDGLPINLVNIEHLVYLSISDGNLTALPSNIGGLNRLEVLSLNCQKLSSLPASLGALNQLSQLEISSDCLNEIPESIGELTDLKRLQVNCTNLDRLPESIGQLKELEELTVHSNKLKEVPQSIGTLVSLNELTLGGNSLEYLPESIVMLTELTKLVLPSDQIKSLPRGLEDLTKLRQVGLTKDLNNKLPESMVEKFCSGDLYLSGVPAAALYQPNMNDFPLSIIGCFILSEGWDEQALLTLKEKVGAYFLVGLQTDDHEYESLDIIEGIVRCQPDEVKEVIKLLDVNSASTIIGIDVVDIKSLFECGSSFQFVHASTTDEPESDLIKVTTHKLVNQLVKARKTKGLFMGMESVQSLPLEAFAYISEAIEELLSDDDTSIYYSSSITDEPNFFHLKAIYALA